MKGTGDAAAAAADDAKKTVTTRRRGSAVLGRVQGASTDEGRNLGGSEAKAEGVSKTGGKCCAR